LHSNGAAQRLATSFMSDRFFVDTNVLVYAHDRGAAEKHELARSLVERLWLDRSGAISTQVLQELYVNIRRKAAAPISTQEARRLIEDYLSWEVVVNDGASVLRALEVEARFSISFWDALIVQAAEQSGAAILYSEDLSHGQRYGSLEVVDPLIG
jgi:predicted nucleic acid-binding protein